MDGIIGTRILQCSDGHRFASSETGRLFRSIHLGPKRLMRCPVDGKVRVMSNVDPWTRTAQQQKDAGEDRT